MPTEKKQRIDQLLVNNGLANDIGHAKQLIMAGQVYAATNPVRKADERYKPSIDLSVKSRKSHQWVSRGGLKLDHAIKHFNVSADGKIGLDIGSSTGGFTDVLLHHGAQKVYAVDVGYNELDWRLRKNPKVVVCERLNAKHLTEEHMSDLADIIVCDASFIGLQSVLSSPLKRAAPGAWLLALIKPQFQVKKEEVGKNGIIQDTVLHTRVCDEVHAWLSDECDGWQVQGITESPITGTKGNKEFIIGATYHG